MQNEMKSPKAGRVLEIRTAAGAAVAAGDAAAGVGIVIAPGESGGKHHGKLSEMRRHGLEDRREGRTLRRGAMRLRGGDPHALAQGARRTSRRTIGDATLENFEIPQDNPTARQGLGTVLMQTRSFVREFPAGERPGLLLVGDSGNRENAPGRRGDEGAARPRPRVRLLRLSESARPDSLGLQRGVGRGGSRGVPLGAGCRSSGARRPGRASRDGMGGGYRHGDHHLPLQSQEAADRDDQSSRRRRHRPRGGVHQRRAESRFTRKLSAKRSACARGRGSSRCAGS